MHDEITIRTDHQGLYEITREVERIVTRAKIDAGLCSVFLRHTSAGLIIQENADPSARRDLESWLARFVPENDSHFTHTTEGPDDMPAHIKSAMTGVSLTIPIVAGGLALGAWQGIYLCEFRRGSHQRKVVVTIMKDSH